MDLPTYTSIWRIEKRLYKLYDFRLPMPLPIGQITVFAAVAVPYVVLLEVLGLPFNHTLIWLYILPPGALTWLATRPVLESKRLPELVRSQLRYLAEPRVWCRMAPSSEPDVVLVTGRVWRARAAARRPGGRPARAPGRADARQPAGARAVEQRPEGVSGWPSRSFAQPPRRPGWPHAGLLPARPAADHEFAGAGPAEAGEAEFADTEFADTEFADTEIAGAEVAETVSAEGGLAAPELAGPALAGPAPQEPGQTARRPAVTVVGPGPGQVRAPAVERALAGPSARRGEASPGRVTVVPGGHRPGRPDQLARDRARARLPIGDRGRIVVLGCTVGAGQTVTALLAGEVLAGLRSDRVAVLDLNPGPGSLAQRAQARPALSPAASLGLSRLTVLGPALPGAGAGDGIRQAAWAGQAQDARAFELAAERHDLVLADPSTAVVPRLLAIADQLVLVAPASAAAGRAIAMTYEWLDAHGQAGLVARAIMVLNGVSRRSTSHVEQAERVCAGRCRAIVRVPWDDQLNGQAAKQGHQAASGSTPRQRWSGLLSPGAAGAYTALAGVLVAAMAERQAQDQSERQPSAAGRGVR